MNPYKSSHLLDATIVFLEQRDNRINSLVWFIKHRHEYTPHDDMLNHIWITSVHPVMTELAAFVSNVQELLGSIYMRLGGGHLEVVGDCRS